MVEALLFRLRADISPPHTWPTHGAVRRGWTDEQKDHNAVPGHSTTSLALLSSRQPRNVVWRNCSSSVHSANATSQTSRGATPLDFLGNLGRALDFGVVGKN